MDTDIINQEEVVRTIGPEHIIGDSSPENIDEVVGGDVVPNQFTSEMTKTTKPTGSVVGELIEGGGDELNVGTGISGGQVSDGIAINVTHTSKRRREDADDILGRESDVVVNANGSIINYCTPAEKVLKQKMARQKRKPKRLAEEESTQVLAPRTGQDPVRMHKDVWILHPEHWGTAIAKGRAGTHYKVPKSKMPIDRPCDHGVQWVQVEDVFVTGVTPMYASRQKDARVMEDATPSSSKNGSWLM
ncbi:hypothetical protein M758_UG175100 [Ceratodon purpureus]|nr:hypothetical protein M758_UG175100 [Ceratodon purpureus]